MRHGILTIDLKKIAENYNFLKNKVGASTVSAVVKADAYGLGVEPIVKTLLAQGCRVFFVADIEEGYALRKALDKHASSISERIDAYVIHGMHDAKPNDFAAHKLIPVLNQPEEIKQWFVFQKNNNRQDPYALHIDTGMSKLGLAYTELHKYEKNLLYSPQLVMSHLSCSDEVSNPFNQIQLRLFEDICIKFPTAKRSLSNSGGIFLGNAYHLDIVRPGKTLYGLDPQQDGDNPLSLAVSLHGRILQIKDIEKETAVGYGRTFVADSKTRIAIVSMGYADGFSRLAGNKPSTNIWRPYFEGQPLKIVGRVSMDLIALDITDIQSDQIQNGKKIEFIGKNNTADQFARAINSIGHEVLTNFGSKSKKNYI